MKNSKRTSSAHSHKSQEPRKNCSNSITHWLLGAIMLAKLSMLTHWTTFSCRMEATLIQVTQLTHRACFIKVSCLRQSLNNK